MKTNKISLKKENEILRSIIKDISWMARRYATGRSSVAPGLYNECAAKSLELGIELNPTADGTIWAEDGMGRSFDSLTDEHLTPNHPIATGRLIGLPPRTHLAEEMRRLLELGENDGIGAAIEKIMELKEKADKNYNNNQKDK